MTHTEATGIVAIIPARGGSKGVPLKNIRPLAGYPLLAYSIAAALLSRRIGRVIVSTDSEEIAAVARAFGAETPFLRPAACSTDTATDRAYLAHAMEWARRVEGRVPEYWVNLRPTTPLRDPAIIDEAIEAFLAMPEATSLRSGHLGTESPFKWFERDEAGFFRGLRPEDPRPEYYNLPRQAFPAVYVPDGYVDIARASFMLASELTNGPRMYGFVSPECTEVDTLEQLQYLEYQVGTQGGPVFDYLTQNHART